MRLSQDIGSLCDEATQSSPEKKPFPWLTFAMMSLVELAALPTGYISLQSYDMCLTNHSEP